MEFASFYRFNDPIVVADDDDQHRRGLSRISKMRFNAAEKENVMNSNERSGLKLM